MAWVLLFTLIVFLQSTVIPWPVLLLVLICRSFATGDRSNYYFGFCSGLLLSLLTGQTMGLVSLVHLLSIKSILVLRRTSLASNWIILVPVSFVLLITYQLSSGLISRSAVNLLPTFLQSLLVVPIYLVIRLGEERFVPRADFRLKV